MDQKHKRCLLINADYSPLGIMSWQRAMVWSMRYVDNKKYGIEIIDFYKNDHIVGVDKKIPIPAVARTRRFFKINNQPVTFSRKNIFIRDNYSCQYCGGQFDIRQLTYDHVVPKSKWNQDSRSPTNWTNIVTACSSCNRRKGNRTPKEADMPLKNRPIVPNKNIRYLPVLHNLHRIKEEIPEEWILYLPPSFSL
jgi:hypothetical protein